jgi:hypothetical protein
LPLSTSARMASCRLLIQKDTPLQAESHLRLTPKSTSPAPCISGLPPSTSARMASCRFASSSAARRSASAARSARMRSSSALSSASSSESSSSSCYNTCNRHAAQPVLQLRHATRRTCCQGGKLPVVVVRTPTYSACTMQVYL